MTDRPENRWSMRTKQGSWWLALLCLVACCRSEGPVGRAHAASSVSVAVAGMRATMDPAGAFVISTLHPAWSFAGATAEPVTEVAAAGGIDRLGPFKELLFRYGSPPAVRGGIRLYERQQAVLFSLQHLLPSSPPARFPALTGYPPGLKHLSYDGEFAVYSFGSLSADSPWLFFDGQDNAFLLSPAANFLLAHTTLAANGALSSGLDPAIARVPRGFTQQTLLVVGRGINATYAAWGQALTALQGKARSSNEATTELRYLGYWTDTGAAYYYNYEHALGYAGTLLAVRRSFQHLGIPLGYMELDSWWYPKNSTAHWQGSGYFRGGIYRYTADPALFPDGLTGFQRRLGLPLVVHARWIDPSSPYRQQYQMSGNVITDRRYWQRTASYLSAAQVITYEQDWLARFARTATNLSDPGAFLDNMAAAMQAQGIDLQYCMPLARDLLQSTRYDNLRSARVSFDHFTSAQWTRALYDSRLAAALGIWPWDDVFTSNELDNLLLATLSAGIVGIGDRLGTLNAANLRRAMRGDGLLVKPDVPLVPTDATYLADAAGLDRPMVAFSYTDHGAARALYVFAYRRHIASVAAIQPATLGLPGAAYIYSYFSRTGRTLAPGATFQDAVGNGSYYLIVPIGPSGMALLGDLSRFVPMSRQRITAFSDTGEIQATLAFGPGESSIVISGYAPRSPLAAAQDGSIGALHYDRTTKLFQLTVSPDAHGAATVSLRESLAGRGNA